MSKNSPYVLLEDIIVTGGRVVVRGMPDMTARENEDLGVTKWSSAPGNNVVHIENNVVDNFELNLIYKQINLSWLSGAGKAKTHVIQKMTKKKMVVGPSIVLMAGPAKGITVLCPC